MYHWHAQHVASLGATYIDEEELDGPLCNMSMSSHYNQSFKKKVSCCCCCCCCFTSKQGSNISFIYRKPLLLHGFICHIPSNALCFSEVTVVNSIHYSLHTLFSTSLWTVYIYSFFLLHIKMSNGDSKSRPDDTEPFSPLSLSSFLCDWINYVSLTLLEVSKHTFSVISHQSMWPWRWKVKHVSQEAGQRGISPLISGPTQSHHSTLPRELKLSLWAMYSELYTTLDLWRMVALAGPIKKVISDAVHGIIIKQGSMCSAYTVQR